MLALSEEGSVASEQEAQRWVAHTAERVQALASASAAADGGDSSLPPPQQGTGRAAANGTHEAARSNGAAVRGAAEQPPSGKAQRRQPGPFRLREGRQRYLQNIGSCMQVGWGCGALLQHASLCGPPRTASRCIDFSLTRASHAVPRRARCATQALHDGESYEVCLTTQLRRQGAPDPRALYHALRATNPAPYAAWLCFGAGDLQLCCCSPERFLAGGRGGQLEAKPIKGTAPRSCDPRQDAAIAAQLAGTPGLPLGGSM